jgi:hypothetical protein
METGIIRQKRTVRISLRFAEIALIFALFFLFGAWSVPDSNEPYYIGKAIHFWQPDWIPNDTFLDGKDSHWTFYAVFGWLSFFCSPTVMTWIGRCITWGLLAWSWQRLSYALVPVRFAAVLTALALAYYVDAFHEAGEWLIGGVEGKSFAFPFVFFALEAMVRRRWNRVWILISIATAFHALVGGWSTLVVGAIWLGCRCTHRNIRVDRVELISIFIGIIIALFGIIPALLLDSGTPPDIVHEAHQIYVFDRLHHHLVPYKFPWTFLCRFWLLAVLWFFLCRFGHTGNRRQRLFDAFVWGALGIAAVGMILAYSLSSSPSLSAEVLRFYWFRLADIAVPMGVAVGACGQLFHLRHRFTFQLPTFVKSVFFLTVPFAIYLALDHLLFAYNSIKPVQGIPWLITILVCSIASRGLVLSEKSVIGFILLMAVLFYAPFESLKTYSDLRTRFSFSRIEPTPTADWQDICRWVDGNTPKTAKFWVPRDGTTFKWHAKRSDVGVWKNIPQDAAGIVQWNQAMKDLFLFRDDEGTIQSDRLISTLLCRKAPEELEKLRLQYGFDYIVCGLTWEMPKQPALLLVYSNDTYCLYRIEGTKK